MHNSKEIVNIQGLFVLTVGYVVITTNLLIKYYSIIERVFLFVVYIIYQYIFILAVFMHIIMEVLERLPPCQYRYFALYYVLY